MCIGMANGGKSPTEDLRKKSAAEAIKSFQERPERFNNSFVETAAERFVNAIKADAIKEFAERLKEKAYLNDGVTGFQDVIVEVNDIDNLVKEMVGDDK